MILTETNQLLTDCITLHFLELPKLKYSDVKAVKRLEAWGAYFAGAPEEELEVLYMNEPLLKDALSYEKVFTNNDDMYRKYQQREDAIRDEQTKIAMGERRGIAIGEKRGIAIGEKRGIAIGEERGEKRGIAIGEKRGIGLGVIQSAINGLKKGYSLDTVSDITGLTIDEIKAIKY